MSPEYPLRVVWLEHEEGEDPEWILETPDTMAGTLEWFDSDDPEE